MSCLCIANFPDCLFLLWAFFMLGHVGRTAYDLNFRLFGIPVRIHPLFWAISFILGYNASAGGVQSDSGFAMIWVLAVFVSILWHEFGHALAARALHWRVEEVVLHHMGGYAALVPPSGRRPVINDILISLAGPCAGFLLYGLIRLELYFSPGFAFHSGPHAALFWASLLMINLYWGLFNLLPVFPLDGGQATRSLLMAFFRNGSFMAAFLSILVAAGAGMYFYQLGFGWGSFIMLMLLIENFRMLQAH